MEDSMLPQYTPSDLTRFWSKVEVTSSCWLWRGSLNHGGYGALNIQGKMVYAHRFSYELHHGLIPTSLLVCHTCDIRCCVNPDHFFLGTIADNLRDMRDKGRQAKGDRHGQRTHPERRPFGERSGTARLTAVDVIEIRRLYATNRFTQAELGIRFSVSGAHIGQIVRAIRWAHI
jgi:hypothetical protein